MSCRSGLLSLKLQINYSLCILFLSAVRPPLCFTEDVLPYCMILRCSPLMRHALRLFLNTSLQRSAQGSGAFRKCLWLCIGEAINKSCCRDCVAITTVTKAGRDRHTVKTVIKHTCSWTCDPMLNGRLCMSIGSAISAEVLLGYI